MSKFSKFGSLLDEQVKASGLPDILFTENADLRMTMRHLVDMTDSADTDNIIKSVNEFEEMESNEEMYPIEFQNVRTISNAFAQKLKSGIDELRQIKTEVSTLCDIADEKAAMRIAEDPVLAKITGIKKDLSMKDINWDVLNEVDEFSVRCFCHDAAGFEPERNINNNVVDIVINQMPCATQYNQIELKPIKLNDEKFNHIVEILHNMIPTVSREYVAGMFRNILDLDTSCAQRAVTAAHRFANGNTAHDINRIMKVAVDLENMIPLLTTDILDLAASTMQELEVHKSVLDAISKVNLYIAYYYRNVIWQNAIMVPGPFRNPDNAEQYEAEGGNTTQLVQHNAKFFKDVKIPVKGVSSKFILQNAERIEKEFSTEALARTAEINKTQNEIKRASFIITATNYLNEQRINKQLHPQFAQTNNLSKYAEAVYDSMADAPTEAKFYKLIFNAKYIRSLVPVIYNKLNDAYTEYAQQTGAITKESCEDLDIKVYSDMVSSYLVDQGILVL